MSSEENTPHGYPASYNKSRHGVHPEAVECAIMALSSWNEKSLSEEGPEYELVEPQGCKRIVGPIIYHCNFIARPKNEGEAENKLFFAEIKKSSKDHSKDGLSPVLACSLCCIIGPVGTETGFRLCKMCDLHRYFIHHPVEGGFTRGRRWAFYEQLAKKRKPGPSLGSCMPLNFDDDLPPPARHARRYVSIALARWNRKCLSEQSPEYELVAVEGIKQAIDPFIFHCNFVAKPKNGSDSKLFFAEIMSTDDVGRKGCNHVCILGAVGTKTGLNGCVMCENFPKLVQHPENVDFTKGWLDARHKKMKMVSRNW